MDWTKSKSNWTLALGFYWIWIFLNMDIHCFRSIRIGFLLDRKKRENPNPIGSRGEAGSTTRYVSPPPLRVSLPTVARLLACPCQSTVWSAPPPSPHHCSPARSPSCSARSPLGACLWPKQPAFTSALSISNAYVAATSSNLQYLPSRWSRRFRRPEHSPARCARCFRCPENSPARCSRCICRPEPCSH